MSKEYLQVFKSRLDEVEEGPVEIKNTRLVTLMEDMEQTYDIPVLYDETYVNDNPEIMKLYREVSYARDFERTV